MFHICSRRAGSANRDHRWIEFPILLTGGKRSRVAPDLVTMMEAGVKGYESSTWYGIVAPAGVPQDIVAKLNSEIIAIVRQPDTSDRLSKEGADQVGNSPQEFGRFIQSEIDKWRKVIRAAGILPG